MALSDLTPNAVRAALFEFDELGRTAFLTKYGFSPSRRYFLVHEGVAYDSKAICGAAHGYIGEDWEPMQAADFSGGDMSVGKRLTALGFLVRDSKSRLQVRDLSGVPLKAECELHRRGTGYVITLMSRGGTIGTPSERNPDYMEGLRALFSRMAASGVVLDAVVLDTDTTRHLPEKSRMLLDAAPITLSPTSDIDSLVSEITGAAAKHSKSTKKSAGNNTKQIQVLISGGGLVSADDVRVRIIGGSVQIFVLTWNPDVWSMSEDELAEAVAATSRGEEVIGRWSTGNRNTEISAGDLLVLFRQGSDRRGLIAIGSALGTTFEDEHYNDPTKIANYVEVAWSEWVPVDERIDVDDLFTIAPDAPWNSMYSSGYHLSNSDAAAILAAWNGAVTSSGQESLTGDESVGALPEGAKKTVTVNRYERSRQARRKCLEHHGTACAVCEIDFGDSYGGIAEGFIHVHHITPISSIGIEYQLDPIADLVPVCPNCHAMLHHGVSEPRSVDELKALLAP